MDDRRRARKPVSHLSAVFTQIDLIDRTIHRLQAWGDPADRRIIAKLREKRRPILAHYNRIRWKEINDVE